MATNNAVNTSLSGQSGTGAFAGNNTPTLTTPRVVTSILDTNGNISMGITATPSAVDYLTLVNQVGGSNPGFVAGGTSTNVGLGLQTKGTGAFTMQTGAPTTPIVLTSGTGGQHQTSFVFSDTAAARTVTFPDASGTVAFTSTAVTQVTKQVFTGSGTYTPTSGMKYCIIECWGSGGGGGGAANSGATGVIFGAGGGGGGYSRLVTTAATIGASQAVTIATGGAGGTAGANPGSSGSASSVGVLCVANGGAGGSASNAAGGAGGTAGTGDIAGTGATGNSGYLATINTVSVLAGQGASSSVGGGGNTRSSQGTGNAATGFAAGGAGGLSAAAAGTAAGGAGSNGLVMITEYI